MHNEDSANGCHHRVYYHNLLVQAVANGDNIRANIPLRSLTGVHMQVSGNYL